MALKTFKWVLTAWMLASVSMLAQPKTHAPTDWRKEEHLRLQLQSFSRLYQFELIDQYSDCLSNRFRDSLKELGDPENARTPVEVLAELCSELRRFFAHNAQLYSTFQWAAQRAVRQYMRSAQVETASGSLVGENRFLDRFERQCQRQNRIFAEKVASHTKALVKAAATSKKGTRVYLNIRVDPIQFTAPASPISGGPDSEFRGAERRLPVIFQAPVLIAASYEDPQTHQALAYICAAGIIEKDVGTGLTISLQPEGVEMNTPIVEEYHSLLASVGESIHSFELCLPASRVGNHQLLLKRSEHGTISQTIIKNIEIPSLRRDRHR